MTMKSEKGERATKSYPSTVDRKFGPERRAFQPDTNETSSTIKKLENLGFMTGDRDETAKAPSEKDKGEQRGGIGSYLPLFVTVRLVAVCQSSWEVADYAIENKRLAKDLKK